MNNSKRDINIDALLSKMEKSINPNLTKNLNKQKEKERLKDFIPKNYNLNEENKKDTVSIESIEEALEILTDPGYERKVLRFYADLVEYDKELCEPILKRDQLNINNIGILKDPINMFIQKKILLLLEKQNALLEKLLANTLLNKS